MSITFNDLPQAVTALHNDLINMERRLSQKIDEKQPDTYDPVYTVEQAADFLSLSVQTIYGLMSRNEIPVMKRSKRCYFFKNDLINYLKAGRKATISELAAEADNFLQTSNPKRQNKKK